MRERVEDVLDRVRSHLKADGVNVELVDVADGVVTVRVTGGCMRCPMSQMALHAGLENALREAVADVKKVVILRSR